VAQARAEYVPALDGLRGLAALIVVLAHTSAALRMPPLQRVALFEGPLHPLINAQGAVQLFFVLSGFVLAGSLARNRTAADLAAYVVKRVFRIYPPFAVALLLAWLLSFFYDASLDLSPFLNRMSRVHLDPSQLLGSLSFPGNAHRQLPVGWTLRVEMIFSLLLPVMLFVLRRSHALVLVALALGLMWVSEPLRFAFPFAIGLVAYEKREVLSRLVAGLSVPLAMLALGAAIVVWSSPWVLGLKHAPVAHRNAVVLSAHGLGSLALIVLAAYRPAMNRLLSLRPVAWLGRVSYSLYLVHFSVLLVIAPQLGGDRSWAVAVPLYAAVLSASLLVSALGYRLVEIPSIRLGNHVCRWLAGRLDGSEVSSARADAG
jgi:peptidoglycan/LPS O-acetylase OafA/YrhL